MDVARTGSEAHGSTRARWLMLVAGVMMLIAFAVQLEASSAQGSGCSGCNTNGVAVMSRE